MMLLTPRLLTRVVLILIVFALSACHSDISTPQGIAERFLDAHYIAIDLPTAKSYCTGLALRRVEDEIRLTTGQAIDEHTRKPQVNYRLLEEKPRDEANTSFLYEATFSVDGAGQFQKKVLLTLRQTPEGWRVANYSEFD